MKEPEKLTVKTGESEKVSALLYSASRATRGGITIILGHGAGASQSSAFMQLYARGLAERGLDALTFNFVYMEQGRHVPDPKARLESCYKKIIAVARSHKKLKANRLVIGGKSMGGRIASQVAADLAEQGDPLGTEIEGLVFLGYPLHPPGNPAKLRTEHLKSIPNRMLFVQGTRDSLGTPDEIRPFIKKLHLPAELFSIEGGDHSFKVPRSTELTQQQVHDAVMDEIVRWCQPRSR